MPAFKRSDLEPAPALGRRSAYLLVIGIGVAIGVLLLGSFALIESREDTWDQARKNAGNLLFALDRDIGRNIAVVDLSLQGVLEALAEPGIATVSPGIRQHALFDRSANAEDLGSLLVLDRSGSIVADSTSRTPHALNFADRDYFKVHQVSPNRGLFVSRAFRSRLGDGDPRFALTRRIDEPDGSFGGVVSATVRLTFFQQLFEKLDVGRRGTIAVVETNGRLLYRWPFREQDLDLDLATRSSSNFARFVSARAGQFVTMSALDGIERLISFRRVGDLPLVLVVSLSTDEIYATWWHKAVVIGAAMLLLCASAIASSLLFWLELRRRLRTERDLERAKQRLEVQASTDGLTGLMNRRGFDAEFDRVFRSAVRSGTSLAVLMIDADFFKRFNDTYGHLAGDNVLRAIGSCMQTHLRRPGDRVARYGGEEFVAILPETTDAAAAALGNRIRLAFGGLHIVHSESPLGVVSISVGVAAASPLVGDKPADLLQLADRCLYAAKANGRNCVQSAISLPSEGVDLADIVLAATTPRQPAPNP